MSALVGLGILALALIGAARVVTLAMRAARRTLVRIGRALARLDGATKIDAISALAARGRWPSDHAGARR